MFDVAGLFAAPQQGAAFRHLPGQKNGDAGQHFAYPRRQGNGQHQINGNADQRPDGHIAALLDTEAAGDGEGNAPNGADQALDHDRLGNADGMPHQVGRQQDLAHKNHPPAETDQNAGGNGTRTPVDGADGIIESSGAIDDSVPFFRIADLGRRAREKGETAVQLDGDKAGNSQRQKNGAHKGARNDCLIGRYAGQNGDADETP